MLRRSAESLSEILGADGGRKDLFTSTVSNVSARHSSYRSEEGDGLKLPLVVQPANSDVEEFFVNIATYHQSRSPVSAFVHVLDEECSTYFQKVASSEKSPVSVSSRSLFGALGAAVGETFLAALGSAEAGAAPSYASCKRSLSFVLTRARAIYPFCRTQYVARKWVDLRNLTGLSVSNGAVSAACDVHSFLFGSDKDSRPSMQGSLPPGLTVAAGEKAAQRALVDIYPQIGPFVSELSGPFDSRMKAFSQLVEEVHRSSKGPGLDSFTIGFFANQIQPGSFSHAKALAKLVEFFPAALVWYGTFCGLSDEFSAGEFGSGLVAKLARDATQPFSFERRPACDLSLEELQVLMRLPLRAEVVKPSQQKIAVVSLLPGVDVSSRYSVEDDQQADADRDRRTNELDELSSRVTMLLEDALALIRRNKSSARQRSESISKRTGKTKPL